MRRLGSSVVVVVLALGAAVSLPAQQPSFAGAPPLNVYLDCRTSCDSDLIRQEIAYVNWVRDRSVADVHVLVTSQEAGAGGSAITLAFLGERGMAGRGDTLVFTTNTTTSPDERRRGLTQRLALGLMQFVARTAAADGIRIEESEAAMASALSQMTPADDPWNAWVFGINMGGSVNGEALYRSRRLDGGVSANRITESWKTEFDANLSYRDSRSTAQDFDAQGNVSSDTTYTDLQRNWNVELLQVKSVTDHVSLGLHTSLASNTYRNQQLHGMLVPAVEFDLFPYPEFTRRRLTIEVGMGLDAFRYADTTIFDKIRETLPLLYVDASYSTRQPWGQTHLSLEHRTYLSDPGKRATDLGGDVSVRVFRGLNVDFGGSYSWIHDQVYLVKGGGSDPVDVLLRRRALLTGFQYDFRVGLSYTFGSIFNNVVNPRF